MLQFFPACKSLGVLLQYFIQVALTYAPGGKLYNVNTYDAGNGKLEYNGIMFRVATILMNSLNASFSMSLSVDKQWGSIVENNNTKYWNGMMGMLQRDEVPSFTIFLQIQMYSIISSGRCCHWNNLLFQGQSCCGRSSYSYFQCLFYLCCSKVTH